MKSWVLVILATLSILSGCEADCTCLAEDWTPVDDVGCFRYFVKPKTFMEAEKNCHRFSPRANTVVHLASIHSDQELEALTEMIPEPIHDEELHVFTGLSAFGDQYTPVWTDGSFFDYNPWLGAPADFRPVGQVYMYRGTGSPVLWDATPSEDLRELTYFCKTPCM